MNDPFPPLESEACDLQAKALIDALIQRTVGSGGGGELLGVLAAHQVPAAAAAVPLQRHAPEQHSSPEFEGAVRADHDRARRLERVQTLTESALAPLGGRAALPPSALGALWQHDVDVIVAGSDLKAAAQALRDADFVDVQPLLQRIGRTTAGVHRFAAHEQGEVLAAVELCTRLDDFGPSADAAVKRASTDGPGLARLADLDAVRRRCAKVAVARHPTVRAAIELLAITARGEPLPRDRNVAVAFHRCADLERRFLAPGPLSEAAATLQRRPNLSWARARARRRSRALARRVRPARFTVGFSGIDGAGKSTQAARLVDGLRRIEVPADAVWLRIGYGDSPTLQGAARLGRRLLPARSGGAMAARAGGAPSDAHATRRGPLGWLWALAVTVNFVWLARRSVRQARGSVLANDRALPDALVGLEEGWGGALGLGLQAGLLERFGPRPDAIFYLRIDPKVALSRKVDIFTGQVLEEHARAYDRLLGSLPETIALDAQRPLEEIGLQVLRAVCEQQRTGPIGAGR